MPRWLFAVLVLAVLQGLLWVLARSLRFLAGEKRRRWLTATVFVAGDGLSLLALSRLFPPLFIAQAWLLALLWLWFLAAVAGFVLYRCARPFAPEKAATALRVFLPTAFGALFAWGFFNANSTVVRHYAVALDKPMRNGCASASPPMCIWTAVFSSARVSWIVLRRFLRRSGWT